MWQAELKKRVEKEFSRLPPYGKAQIYAAIYQGKQPLGLFVKEWLCSRLTSRERPQQRDIFVEYSGCTRLLSESTILEALQKYDVVSFDLFDTILFRRTEKPTDVFMVMEERIGLAQFARQREQAEWAARQKKHRETGSYEINLREIYEAFPALTPAIRQELQVLELTIEAEQLTINPVMKRVVEGLQAAKKRIIAISDMYLGAEELQGLLHGCGFSFTDELYVSSEFGLSKRDSQLFLAVQQLKSLKGKRIVHVGDNFCSDVYMGREIMAGCLQYIH